MVEIDFDYDLEEIVGSHAIPIKSRFSGSYLRIFGFVINLSCQGGSLQHKRIYLGRFDR